MAQSQRVKALSDGSDMITVLAEYIKNPKIIKDLAQEVVDINKLTADEERLHTEAVMLLQQRDTLANEILLKKDELADELAKHERAIAAADAKFDKKTATAIAELEERKAALDARQLELEAEALRLHEKDIKLKSKADVIAGLAAD